MPTSPLTDRLAALSTHARGLLGLLPGSGAFRAAGIRTKLKVLFYATAFFAIAAIGAYGYFNASTAYRERAVQLLESHRDEVAGNIDEFNSGKLTLLGVNNQGKLIDTGIRNLNNTHIRINGTKRVIG